MAAGRSLGDVVEECALADAGLPANHQRGASAGARPLEQPVEHKALLVSAAQHDRGSRATHPGADDRPRPRAGARPKAWQGGDPAGPSAPLNGKKSEALRACPADVVTIIESAAAATARSLASVWRTPRLRWVAQRSHGYAKRDKT